MCHKLKHCFSRISLIILTRTPQRTYFMGTFETPLHSPSVYLHAHCPTLITKSLSSSAFQYFAKIFVLILFLLFNTLKKLHSLLSIRYCEGEGSSDVKEIYIHYEKFWKYRKLKSTLSEKCLLLLSFLLYPLLSGLGYTRSMLVYKSAWIDIGL